MYNVYYIVYGVHRVVHRARCIVYSVHKCFLNRPSVHRIVIQCTLGRFKKHFFSPIITRPILKVDPGGQQHAKNIFIVYTVHCTVYTYSAQRKMYIVQCILYSIHYTMYKIHYSVFSIQVFYRNMSENVSLCS